MRTHGALLAVILGWSVGTVWAVPADDRAKIAQLVAQLGSNNYRQREAATRDLDAIGEPALGSLRRAAKSADMEVANRAVGLIARIEQRCENARLIAPTMVELTFENTPIVEAVAELAKKGNNPIVIGGDHSKLADRNVTLETGKVPFWKALEMLCERANLVVADPKTQGVFQPIGQPLPLGPNPAPQPPQLRKIPMRPQPASNGAMILLMVGDPKALPSHVEGAFRIRAVDATIVPNPNPVPDGEIGLGLEVMAEQKLQVQQIIGVKIDKAIDSSGQALEQVIISPTLGEIQFDRIQILRGGLMLQAQIAQPAANFYIGPPNIYGNSIIPARLKKGEKAAKSIKELRGSLSLRMRTPVEELAVIENVLKAKGESVKGKSDSTLKIVDVVKAENGDIKIDVELQFSNEIQPGAVSGPAENGPQPRLQPPIPNLPAPPMAMPFGVQPFFANNLGLVLLNENGQSIRFISIAYTKNQFLGNGHLSSFTIAFRPGEKETAAKLVFKGTRLATVEVPFILKDVAVK